MPIHFSFSFVTGHRHGGFISNGRLSSIGEGKPMSDKQELVVSKEGPVCTLIINNTEKRNALTRECHSLIGQTFEELSHDKKIRVVIIRGAGEEAFSAGADIKAMPIRGGSAEVRRRNLEDYIEASYEAVMKYPYPVIAMLYGYTLGAGCVLAMACDIRIASTNVKMGIPTSRMGLIATHQGFKRLFDVLGYSTALEIFLTGRTYDGQDCRTMGLVNHLVDHDQLETYTYKMADEITRCAPLSLRGSKYILGRIADNPLLSVEDIEKFQLLSRQAAASDDHEEAKKAFKEKRKPVFYGA